MAQVQLSTKVSINTWQKLEEVATQDQTSKAKIVGDALDLYFQKRQQKIEAQVNLQKPELKNTNIQ